MRKKEIKIRLSNEEFAWLEAKKTKKQLAVFIRETVLCSKELKKTNKKILIDEKLSRALAIANNNLNQIAKACNLIAKNNQFDSTVDGVKIMIEVLKVNELMQTVLDEVKKK